MKVQRQRQRGVALVVTLIMLSVVTVMAVVFLGISRRERASVGVSATLTSSRLAADAGAARAQAEVLGRIASSNNLFINDFFVSTNYILPQGFLPGVSDIENVNYTYDGYDNWLNQDDLLQNLTNLFLDPRAPVFVRTDRHPTDPTLDRYDFRYYLDLNRNREFDTNGLGLVFAQNQIVGTNFLWGDPEWVGILERPDWPHSSSNRFVARYAYAVLPAGRSLDINHIHNRSKELGSPGASRPGYNRNQGVGSFELNLAAFLRTWLPTRGFARDFYPANQYFYNPEGFVPHDGTAFWHADAIVRYRHRGRVANTLGPRTMQELWLGRGLEINYLRTNGVDYYADNIFRYSPGTGMNPLNDLNDPVNQPWPGADSFNGYQSVSEFYNTNKVGLVGDYLEEAGFQPDTTNRYAFYRLISQMGTDSIPVSRGKINLNYANAIWSSSNLLENGAWDLGTRPIAKGKTVVFDGAETNLVRWSDSPRNRQDFFMTAADSMLKEVFPRFLPGGLEEGIQVFPTNYYSGAVHRCLQLAANLLEINEMTPLTSLSRRVPSSDGTNTLLAPYVFRPIYEWDTINGSNVLEIVGYQEVTNTVPLQLGRWFDATDQTQMRPSVVQPGDNLYGVPWVIGAQKGWPSFNEFYCESMVLVTRRMRASKPTPSSRNVSFQQGYEIGISNLFGLEAWNAYTQNVGANLSLLFTNVVTMGLVDSNRTEAPYGRPGLMKVLGPYPLVQTNMLATNWVGRDFRVFTNKVEFIPRSSYLPGVAASPLRSNVFGVLYDPSPGYRVPNWRLEITNRVLYAMTVLVGTERRIVDLVSLNPLVAGFDIQRFMAVEGNLFGSDGSSDPGRFWLTNRLVNSIMAMPAGITNQLFVSTNDQAARLDWSNWSEDPVSGMQRERAIDEFRMFMGLPPMFENRRTNTPVVNIQVPFTPTRRLLQRMSWQANDPLVHYTFDDIYSTEYANPTNVVPIRPSGSPDGYTPGLPNLGLVNTRYSPWGGRPNKQLSGQNAAYNPSLQDPGVTQADDWEFPTNALPHVGYLGRVHRGTPWQSVYLKSRAEPMQTWLDYAGETRLNAFSHPTNDWRLLDLFSASLTESMTQGLLSVNQTNAAAWAAVFGGLLVQTNTVTSLNPAESASYSRVYIDPDIERRFSDQFYRLVEGINTNRLTRPTGQYQNLGDVLSAPILTDQSPFLNLTGLASGQARINDAVYEGLPQQILGLLKSDEPYFVIYSYGQSLRPAENSVVLNPLSTYYNVCTNYEITGEALTKTGVRIERSTVGTNVFYNAVVEDFRILPVD